MLRMLDLQKKKEIKKEKVVGSASKRMNFKNIQTVHLFKIKTIQ